MICKVNTFYERYKKIFTERVENDILIIVGIYLISERLGFMFRLWGKIWKDNHMIKDTVICNETEDTRTHKVFAALEAVCYQFDLGKPIWLEKTVEEFKRHDKARFYQDNFIEEIEFDYLEIQVIEED